MKSIFTKLSTLLLCGAVALVGCTDYSEDIQAVDKNVNDLKTEFEGYKTSTAATIAELQSAIDALEAAQEQMAAEYAKKSELESAVTTLQNLVAEKAEALQAALTDAAGKIAALEAGKADKTEVAALQEQVTKAIEDANAAISALEAAKADKAELELVKADVASLIEGYTQTIVVLQNLSTALTATQEDLAATQEDLDVVEKDVEALKTAAAEAVYAITNLQASIDALSARVESLEKDLAAVKQQIAQHTEALTNLAGRLEAVEGAVEDEAALRAEADEALQQAVMLLNDGLTNLSFSYNAYVEEMEAYKENLAKEMDELRAQDAALANSILSYYNESIAAVDSAIATLREEQAAAIADLKAEILAAWEDERALIYNTINDIQTTLQAAIAEGDAALQEQLDQAVADIYKTILSYVADLQVEIAEGDANIQANLDDAVALIYKTIESYAEQLRIEMSEIAAVLQKNIDDLTATVTKNYNELNAKIDAVEAALVESVNAVINRVEVLEGKVATLEEQAENMAAAIEDINATIEVLEEMDAALAEQIAKADADAKKALKDARKELQEQIDALVEAKEDLQVRVAVLEELVASNAADIQNNTKEIEANIKAISNLAKQLGSLEATVNALMQSNAAVASALQAKDVELQNNIDAVVSDLANAIARIGAVEDAVKALQELAATLASKDELAKLEQKMNQIQDMLLTLMVAAEDRANDKIQQLRNLVAEANEAIAALRGDVDSLLARVQSLVYVPDYSDGKANIGYALITAPNLTVDKAIIPSTSKLTYKINAENAAQVAAAIADVNNFAFEVKTVKTRAAAAEAALEIKNVEAKDGYLIFDVMPKNFAPAFFLDANNMYSVSLKLADGNNNAASEFTNLQSVKLYSLTPAIYNKNNEPYKTREHHEIAYDKANTEVVILEDNHLVFIDENGSILPETEVAKLDLDVKRVLFAKHPSMAMDMEWAELVNGARTVTETDADGNLRVLYKAGYNADKNDFTVAIGDKFTKNDKGNIFVFDIIYTVNGVKLSADSEIELTAKQVSYEVPAINVPWSVAVAYELAEKKSGINLYALPIVRHPKSSPNVNLEDYSLEDILTDGEAVRTLITLNDEEVKGVEISHNFTDDAFTLELSGAYAFAEHNVKTNNVYKVTWVKDYEAVRATVTATFILGKKAAPVVINMPKTTLKLEKDNNYYSADDLSFHVAAYKEFAKFSGYDDAESRKMFKESWTMIGASGSKPNYVMVNDEVGHSDNVSYVNGEIRLYNDQTLAKTKDGKVGVQKFESVVNGFWFGIPFTFITEADVDVPTNILVYSDRDFVVDHTFKGASKPVKTVYVDAHIVDDVYTVDQADLGKYFSVSKDADNTNDLQVTFEVKTANAPNPEYNTVGVEVDTNPLVPNYILVKDQAVIRDWKNGDNNFTKNIIEVEAVLTANGFELDRKPVVLYAKDPLTFTVTPTLRVPRYTQEAAYANTLPNISLVSRLEGELVDKSATTVDGLLVASTAKNTYGAVIEDNAKKVEVYTVVGGVKEAYDSSKWSYQDGQFVLYADDAILQNSIFAEVEYTLTHDLNEKTKSECTQKVTVEFYPAERK